MSTRSTISYEHATSRAVRSIYCHYDGYLSHNGVMLAVYHDTDERARRLATRPCGIRSLGVDAPEGVAENDHIVSRAHFPDRSEDLVDADAWASGSLDTMQGKEEFNYVWAAKYRMWFVSEGSGLYRPLKAVLDEEEPQWRRIQASAAPWIATWPGDYR